MKFEVLRIGVCGLLWLFLAPAALVMAQVPTISSLSPARAIAGATVTVNGSNFFEGEGASQILFDDNVLDAVFVSSTQITFQVPSNADCNEEHYIYVFNPSRPDGGGRVTSAEHSERVDFDVLCPLALHEVLPIRAKPERFVRVLGQGFNGGFRIGENLLLNKSVVLLNGREIPTDFIHEGELNFTVPANESCGQKTLQVKNPSLGGLDLVSVSHEFHVFCIGSLSPNQGSPGTEVEITGGGFVGNTNPNVIVLGGSEVHFDGSDIGGEYVSNSRFRFVVPQDAACGQHEIRVFNNSVQFIPLVQAVESNPLTFEVTGAPCNQGNNNPVPQPPPPPPFTEDDELEAFDANGDCTLSDLEFFAAVDSWIAQQIGNTLFFAVVDAWIGGFDICVAATSSRSISLRMATHGLRVISHGSGVIGDFEVWDTGGRRVNSHFVQGNQFFWNLRDANNHPVANGVFFVRVQGSIKPFIIMR